MDQSLRCLLQLAIHNHRAVSDVELNDYARQVRLRGFLGCTTIDKLPKRLDPGQSLIINIQPSTDGNGTHWIALARGNGRKYSLFDPLGLGQYVDSRILSLCKHGDLDVNTSRVQDISSKNCGIYCLMWLRTLNVCK